MGPIVAVAIVRGDAAGVPHGGGVGRSRIASSVAERTLRHMSSRSASPSSSWATRFCATAAGRVETRRERASSVRVSYLAMVGWLGAPKAALKWSTMVETKGRHTTRLATKGLKGGSKGRAEAKTAARDPRGGLPPGVIREVTPKEALTEAHNCPSKSKRSPLMRMWHWSLDTSAHCLVSRGRDQHQ